jgi:hypothetical protein
MSILPRRSKALVDILLVEGRRKPQSMPWTIVYNIGVDEESAECSDSKPSLPIYSGMKTILDPGRAIKKRPIMILLF